MADTPSKTAIAALSISILTACFSIFQWWNTEKQARILTAIDVSRNFYKESNQLSVAIIEVARGKELSDDEADRLSRGQDYLNYIAKLANENQLDKTFLSRDMHCMMLELQQLHDNKLKELGPTFSKTAFEYPDLRKFALTADCPYKSVIDSFLTPLPKPKASEPQ